MQPDRKTGGVVLEHGRDRRYARAAARRIGDWAMKAAVNAGENQVWNKLYQYKHPRVSRDEISSARMWGWILNYKFTEFKTESGVVEEIARDYANDRIGRSQSQLNAEHVSPLIEGLEAIADGSRVRAALSFTRKATAAQMLIDLHQR